MGCDPVVLIGVDHSYALDPLQSSRHGNVLTSLRDDPNHFHPGYFGAGYRWHDPRTDRMEKALASFRKYVPHDLVRYLIENDKDAEVGWEKRELTIFFSDVQGFKALQRTYGEEAIQAQFSEYLEEFSRIIMEQGGTVDKFIANRQSNDG